MQTNLEVALDRMQREKETKLIPENVRYGTKVFGVQGTLKPVTVEGGDTGTNIFLQPEAPANPDGLWVQTDKTYDDIYVENERHTDQYSMIYSNDSQDNVDPRNIIRNRTAPSYFEYSSYCQKGNIVHIFGAGGDTSHQEQYGKQHYKYDFTTDTWTKLTDCPISIASGHGNNAVWTDEDTIFIIGSNYQADWDNIYKYTISSDAWERMTGLSDVITSFSNTPNSESSFSVCYDSDDTIYFIESKESSSSYNRTALYKYAISTNIVELFIDKMRDNYDLVGNIVYNNNNIYYSFANDCIGAFNISEHTVSTITDDLYHIRKHLVLNYPYIMSFGSITSTRSSITDMDVTNIDTKENVTINNTNNVFSHYFLNADYPICYFTSNQFDIIVQLDDKNHNQCGLILEDKPYEFENNTLIIYGNGGKYKTQLFYNSKLLTSNRLLTYFDDVRLYDKESDTLIKDLPAYYGDGEKWVKFK